MRKLSKYLTERKSRSRSPTPYRNCDLTGKSIHVVSVRRAHGTMILNLYLRMTAMQGVSLNDRLLNEVLSDTCNPQQVLYFIAQGADIDYKNQVNSKFSTQHADKRTEREIPPSGCSENKQIIYCIVASEA